MSGRRASSLAATVDARVCECHSRNRSTMRAPSRSVDAGVGRRRFDDTLARTGGGARLAARPPRRRRAAAAAPAGAGATISPRSLRLRARCCATAPPTSCSSAPAARASAARRWRSSPATRVPGVGAAARRAAPALHGQSRSRDLRRAAASGCRSRPRASSRSRSPAAPARR